MRNGAKQQNPYMNQFEKIFEISIFNIMTDYRITNIKMILKKKKTGFFLPERAVVSDIF